MTNHQYYHDRYTIYYVYTLYANKTRVVNNYEL